MSCSWFLITKNNRRYADYLSKLLCVNNSLPRRSIINTDTIVKIILVTKLTPGTIEKLNMLKFEDVKYLYNPQCVVGINLNQLAPVVPVKIVVTINILAVIAVDIVVGFINIDINIASAI